MKTLEEFTEKLKQNIERAETDDWCVLSLGVKEGEELIRLLERSDNSDYAKCPKCGSKVNKRLTYFGCNDDNEIGCDWNECFE